MAGFDVTPSELHGAGATLRGVRSELSGNGVGAGGMAAGDVGYPDLAGALAGFCQMAGTTAAALAQAVDLAGQNTERAGTDYERAESANAAMAGG